MPGSNVSNTSVPLHGIKAKIATVKQYIEWYKMERWLISGTEVHSGEKFSIIYNGVIQNKNYFAGLVFGSNYTEEYLGSGHIPELLRRNDNKNIDCSMVVTEGVKTFGKTLLRNHFFFIPGWVNGEIYLTDIFTDIINNRGIKSDLNRIKKNKLVYEITHDLSAFNQFYYEMYRPLMRKRHGNAAIINTYGQLYKKFKKNDLFMIKKEEMVIAGALVSHNKISGRLLAFGVLDGKDDYIHEGVMTALYYFPIKYLHEQNCRRICLGRTRAFLNDGVMFYKKKWGYKVVEESSAGFFIKVVRLDSGVIGFLQANPYITVEKRESSVVFFSKSKEAAPEILNILHKNYLTNGFDNVILSSYSAGMGIGQTLKIPIDGV